jgi:hypothetical protein
MMVGSSPSRGSLESSQRKLARSNIHASTAALRQRWSFSSSQLLSPERTWALCLGTQAERPSVTAVVVFEIRLSAR